MRGTEFYPRQGPVQLQFEPKKSFMESKGMGSDKQCALDRSLGLETLRQPEENTLNAPGEPPSQAAHLPRRRSCQSLL